MRITLRQLKESSVPRVLGLCSTDERLVDYVNEAIERLTHRPEKWWGIYQRYAICVNENCITWPRAIAQIEKAAVCNSPIRIRSGWYEFLPSGPGIQEETGGCDVTLIQRENNYVTFNDISGSDCQIKVYADVPEDDDAQILVLGYDENNNWIRTEVGGEWVDGEYIDINNATPSVSTKIFTAVTGIIKPATNGVVRINSIDSNNDEINLGIYEPDEETPSYRRSLVTGIDSMSTDGECDTVKLTVVAKLEFYNVSNDNDFLLIPCIPALKDMCIAIKKYDAGLFRDGSAYEAKAVETLNRQLGHYLGEGGEHSLDIRTANYPVPGVENVM